MLDAGCWMTFNRYCLFLFFFWIKRDMITFLLFARSNIIYFFIVHFVPFAWNYYKRRIVWAIAILVKVFDSWSECINNKLCFFFFFGLCRGREQYYIINLNNIEHFERKVEFYYYIIIIWHRIVWNFAKIDFVYLCSTIHCCDLFELSRK